MLNKWNRCWLGITPEVSNSALRINLKLPPWIDSPQLIHLLSIFHFFSSNRLKLWLTQTWLWWSFLQREFSVWRGRVRQRGRRIYISDASGPDLLIFLCSWRKLAQAHQAACCNRKLFCARGGCHRMLTLQSGFSSSFFLTRPCFSADKPCCATWGEGKMTLPLAQEAVENSAAVRLCFIFEHRNREVVTFGVTSPTLCLHQGAGEKAFFFERIEGSFIAVDNGV